MAFKTFTFADADKGINLQLPGNKAFWTTGRNVRFTQGFVSQSLGKSLKVTTPGAHPLRGLFSYVNPYGYGTTIAATDTTMMAYNAAFTTFPTPVAAVDVTPAVPPTGDADSVWTFALVGGLLFVSNGKDGIWRLWDTAGAYGKLTLSNVGTSAKFIGSCMHRLILSNVTVGGVAMPGRIMWSEPGKPENFVTDFAADAGYFDLMDYQTGAAAVVPIKGQIVVDHKVFIFGEKGLWSCDFSQQLKQFVIVDPEVELLSNRAACRVGHMMYWLGKTDVHRSIIGKAEDIGLPIRDYLFDNLNLTYAKRAFAFAPHGTTEVWFCVPTGVNTDPDTAYIYNYELDCWTIQNVDFLCHAVVYDDTASAAPPPPPPPPPPGVQ